MSIVDNTSRVLEVDINEILPNRFQPRRQFDEDEILELSDSIREHGIIQPIVVRTVGDKYEIIAGERRYKASVLAGLESVPVIVKNLNDKDSAEIALIENIQRKNLTPIEEALSYKQILDMGYLTQEKLATKLGKSQSSIANKIRLLNLSDEVQEALLENKISERHARSLLRLQGEESQNKMLDKIISERLTVRKTDEEIDKVKNGLDLSENIKEEKEEESMNNSINMMPNMTSPQDTQSSFNFLGNAPTQTVEQPNTQSVPSFNMESIVQPQGFDMFANSNMPSINIPNISTDMAATPTQTVEQPNIQSVPSFNTESIVQPQGFDMFANSNMPSINIPNISTDMAATPTQTVEQPSSSTFNFSDIPPIIQTPTSENKNNENQPMNYNNFQNTSVENTAQVPTFDAGNNTQMQTQNNNIQFDANGMVIQSQAPVTSPIIDQPNPNTTPQVPTFDMGNNTQMESQNNGIQFDANGMVIQPQIPVTSPIIDQLNPNTTPQVPTFDMGNNTQMESQNNGIQFDANGMVIQPQVPVTSPIIDQPNIDTTLQVPTFDMENNMQMNAEPVETQQPVTPQIDSLSEQVKVPEPIIVTDYNKQYDPIMPNQQNAIQQKAPLKEVINAIRECSEKIEKYGYKLDVEEYDLTTIYQVVFKVEK